MGWNTLRLLKWRIPSGCRASPSGAGVSLIRSPKGIVYGDAK